MRLSIPVLAAMLLFAGSATASAPPPKLSLPRSSEEDLRKQLARVPEIDLQADKKGDANLMIIDVFTDDRAGRQVGRIKEKDLPRSWAVGLRFVQKSRADLQGLPLHVGAKPADEKVANLLRRTSRAVRGEQSRRASRVRPRETPEKTMKTAI